MAAFVSVYARAFADVVSARGLDPEQAVADLEAWAQVLAASAGLRTILQNPGIPAEQKRRVIDGISRRIETPREVRNFVAVLVDHRRIGSFREVINQCKRELNDRLGIAEAEITSARELDAQEKRLLEAEVSRTTGRSVRASYTQDSKLIGGAVVRVGSTIYDGSVRGQLQKLKEQLASS